MTKLYKCDPEKNKECAKSICFLYGGPCELTRHIEWAKTDQDGKPIEDNTPTCNVDEFVYTKKELE